MKTARLETPTQVDAFADLARDVIDPGLCTHCGTCIGLHKDKLEEKQTAKGPVPVSLSRGPISSRLAYEVCPGRKIDYHKLNEFVFGKTHDDFILGQYLEGSVGFSMNETVRRNGASGGIITATLLYLLEIKQIDGAVVLQHGEPKPWLARPIIATTAKEILACAQSVYTPVMMNTILHEIKDFGGNLAYVGLPDQVAAIRALQRTGHEGALKIKFIIGPYVGMSLYLEAIASYLRSNKVKNIEDVEFLRYRDGEWPGHMRIVTKSGRTLMSPKFHYNYLIPFYVTTASLLSVDFSNELTDISVGDAWNPHYEERGKGYSVILGRTRQGSQILRTMEAKRLISLEKKTREELLNMHAHMIDFKKRGSFIRMGWMRLFGRKVPQYDYCPQNISVSRYALEIVVSSIFFLGRWKILRWVAEKIPLIVMGRLFQWIRGIWKATSKATKRRGLMSLKFRSMR